MRFRARPPRKVTWLSKRARLAQTAGRLLSSSVFSGRPTTECRVSPSSLPRLLLLGASRRLRREGFVKRRVAVHACVRGGVRIPAVRNRSRTRRNEADARGPSRVLASGSDAVRADEGAVCLSGPRRGRLGAVLAGNLGCARWCLAASACGRPPARGAGHGVRTLDVLEPACLPGLNASLVSSAAHDVLVEKNATGSSQTACSMRSSLGLQHVEVGEIRDASDATRGGGLRRCRRPRFHDRARDGNPPRSRPAGGRTAAHARPPAEPSVSREKSRMVFASTDPTGTSVLPSQPSRRSREPPAHPRRRGGPPPPPPRGGAAAPQRANIDERASSVRSLSVSRPYKFWFCWCARFLAMIFLRCWPAEKVATAAVL